VDPETGDVLGSYGSFGAEDGRFHYPSSVAYDPTADWYVVADTQNNRVQIVRLEGSGGGLQEAAVRLGSSPSRYAIYPLLVPLVLLLLILIVWIARKIAARRRAAAEQAAIDREDVLATPGPGEDAVIPPPGAGDGSE
jgi:hypothetical protein